MKEVLAIISLIFLLTSCTVNMLQTDTHGTASDVVDETSSAQATVSPNLNIPVKPL